MNSDLFSPEEIGRYHLNSISKLINDKLNIEEQDEIYYHILKVKEALER